MKRFVLFPFVLLLMTAPALTAQNPPAVSPSTPAAAGSQPANDAQGVANDPNDPLFGVPPLPKGTVSLVGGTVSKIDRVKDRITVNVFGKAGKMDVSWDERTHIYRDGVETTERGIQKGDRVYVDTMQDGPRIFARNIRIVTTLEPADARGQILSYDPRHGMMAVQDDLSGQPVSFHVTDKTTIQRRQQRGTTADLIPGALVAVRFAPGKEFRGVAQQVSILAKPGSQFVFAGKVTHLDVSHGVLSLNNRTDHRTYDISFNPSLPVAENLQVGSDLTINATFNGSGYSAQNITLNPQSQAQKE